MALQLRVRPKLTFEKRFRLVTRTFQQAPAVDTPVWGYQRPESFQLPDFTPQQLSNRASQASLVRLVDSYRRHAHRSASLDPLSLTPRPSVPALDPRRYGFGVSPTFLKERLHSNHLANELPSEMIDMLGDETKLWSVDGVVGMGTRTPGGVQRTLGEIIDRLQQVYCGRIAYEYMHLPNKSEREWLSDTLESKVHDMSISEDCKLHYWRLLYRSEAFDKFLATKFPNVKRYGLEGGESMLVALDRIFEECSAHGVKDVVVAMPHRGRLNFLTQLLSLDLNILLNKLKGKGEISGRLLLDTPAYTGDVLSHLTTSTALRSRSYPNGKPVNVHVLPNPSHLEAISPVGLGFARALNMLDGVGPYTESLPVNEKRIGDEVLSVQIHGDAAFGGQGVVAETLNLSTLPHFTVGGSVRLVLNNQLGYTTPATEGRTSFYATDIGKSISAPIIHVNGEYPEDVSRALSLAFAFRNQFRKDVLIDLVVYRRWGHNELDEPTYTSPHMYRKIDSLPSVPTRYEKELLDSKVFDEQTLSKIKSTVDREFAQALDVQPNSNGTQTKGKTGLMDLNDMAGNRICPPHKSRRVGQEAETGVSLVRLQAAGRASVSTPKDFNVHPRLQKMHVQKRLQALESNSETPKPTIDFSTAEALAFGTLLEDGFDIRLSGQDSGRGTFSQRHALLTDQDVEGRTVVPLNELAAKDPGRGKLEIVNSPLSEYSVMGFEIGFSYMTSRSCLVLWEAQFGDFVNTAQVIVDHFIVSGQFKWPTFQTGLVLLLPHGLDGAGPEHSSCRIERFLQAANEPWLFGDRANQIGFEGENISVCNATTPAQYFHLLRRQMKTARTKSPKGLIVATPKTMLRARETFSLLTELGPGTSWKDVLDDPLMDGNASKNNVQRLVICSGKVYYDLVKKRHSLGLDSKVALVRIEELTPFPYRSLHHVIRSYPTLTSVIWAQEEPENSGALSFVAHRIREVLANLGNPSAFLCGDERSQSLLSDVNHDATQSDTNDKQIIKLGFVARPSCASSATGISERFKSEQVQLENQVFDLNFIRSLSL
ncbi:oxoglutarate dehydrogenase (succinyl-transferring), E1 component [Puccinia striiformis f. sp. tritici PST-78]|uniref:Oxoglutarate dehydrogenase (Succinyl-transferring), E1 component n=1 Tax=Puccinia striiformis f. sp. tritici PST-78 TaxID=1165861 RepID=A0A0L0VWL4_9BASI|nr:oxoglutarate dehydrogenase (succinyl-transferring), E1 component [Puccinia striiformis f. sp. tritici PST-78]